MLRPPNPHRQTLRRLFLAICIRRKLNPDAEGEPFGFGSSHTTTDDNAITVAETNEASWESHGVDFVVPAAAAEDAVMANPRLHVVHLHILPQSRAKVLRGEGLAEAANIVPLAFDGQQRGALDGARIDQAAMHLELTEGQNVVLEDQFHRFEIELGRQVHYREIFLIERLDELKF